jgi:hypothetical protein
MPTPRLALLAALLPALFLFAISAATAKGGAPKPYPFAPYVDMADYPPPTLSDFRTGGGVEHVSLGFVTAEGGTACKPTWGGYSEYAASGKDAYQLDQVKSFQQAGGDVVVSFGGQAGTELATVCKSVGALSAAYRKAISAYHADHVDFDVEGATIADRVANTRRAKAIAKLQRGKGRKLFVSYTLPVLPSGLDDAGMALVKNAVSKKASIGIVNGMAMDYGEQAAPDPEGKMGDLAISVANGMSKQLAGTLKVSAAKAMSRVGITPMIGINDVSNEIFTLADAHKLAEFASSAKLGMVGMWQLSRDRQCDHPTTETQLDCSGVDQDPWDFSKALGAFTG